MNITKLITDVVQLVQDVQHSGVLADVEAIIADLQPVATASAEEIQANGDIIKALIALLTQLASNPIVMQIILALLGGLVNPTPVPTPVPTT